MKRCDAGASTWTATVAASATSTGAWVETTRQVGIREVGLSAESAGTQGLQTVVGC